MIIKSASHAAKGIKTGTTHRINKAMNNSQYPTFLVYQLTNSCNSRCQMCNIWKKDSSGELSVDEIRLILSKPIFKELRWVNLTGGEPFMREDIAQVAGILSTLPKLEGIAIPSNGFLTDRIVDGVEEILKTIQKKQFLSVTLSIDGFEETHDDIRGVPGSFKKVMKTLDALLLIKKKHKNFNVGIQPTISKRNLSEIWDFYKEMKKKCSVGFAVMLTSEGYYSNTDSKIALNKEDKKVIAKNFRKIIKKDPQYGFYYSKLIDLFKTGKRKFGCLGGYLTMFMDPFGNVSPCPVLSCNSEYSFGSIKNKIWTDKRAKSIRNNLKDEPTCKSCSMMCDFINFAKVEFFEHTMWLLQHPKTLKSLLKKISSEPNPYY